MSVLQHAFPLLIRGGDGGPKAAAAAAALRTRLCPVSHAPLEALQTYLQDLFHATFPLSDEGLHCMLRVGTDIAVPITIVGTCVNDEKVVGGEECLMVHSPGLPGGFVVTRDELVRSRARVCGLKTTTSSQPSAHGSMCLMEAATKRCFDASGEASIDAASPHGILDAFYRVARRRHFSLVGMERLLERGSQIYPAALQLDFPYQCGGAQAAKRYLDITEQVTNVFDSAMRHGTKFLSRYGIAVSVGVVDRLASLATPAMMWHPSGASAACLAPVLHGCPLLPVGAVTLDYNGPVPGSALTLQEDPRRYMNIAVQGNCDDSLWLTQGLFGVKPGDVWLPPWQGCKKEPATYEVIGVGYDEESAEMELLVRDSVANMIIAAADT